MLDLDRRLPEKWLRELPIFPLPNVVLLPGLELALNVFEHRYLALVATVLEQDGFFGIPLLQDPRRHQEAAAPIASVFGVGRIVDHHAMQDGRYLIRVEGCCRVRLEEELEGTLPFRRVSVSALEEGLPQNREKFEVLRAVVERLSICLSTDDQAMVKAWLQIDDPRVALYGLGAVIPSLKWLHDIETGRRDSRGPPELHLQQACLEACSPDARVELLLKAAQEILEAHQNDGLSYSELN